MGYIFRSYIADDRRLRSHKTFFFASIPEEPPTCLRSWTQVNFAGTSAAKACDGCCCRRRMFSYVGTVSQAVPATVSQVVRRHMRTRLKSHLLWRISPSCPLNVGWQDCFSLRSKRFQRAKSYFPVSGRARNKASAKKRSCTLFCARPISRLKRLLPRLDTLAFKSGHLA